MGKSRYCPKRGRVVFLVELPNGALRSFLDHTPFPAWHAGADSLRDFFNRAWTDFTGRSLEQEVGEGWLKGIHEDDRESHIRVYRDAVRSGKEYRLESRIKHADGGFRWVVETGIPLSAESGLQGFIGFIQDTTELKRLRSQLDMAYSKSKVMWDAIPLPAVTIDPEGRILSWNAAAQMRLGYGLFEVIGRNIRNFIPESHRQKVLGKMAEIFDQAIIGGNAFGKTNVKLLAKDGSEVLVEAHYLASRTEEGPTLFSLLVDLTPSRLESVKEVNEAETFKRIFEKSPAPLLVMAPDGRILRMTGSMASLLGYKSEDVLGKEVVELAHREEVPLLKDDLRAAIEGGESFISVERRFNTGSGETRIFRVTYSTVQDASGRPTLIVAHLEDVVREKNMEQQLASEIARLQSELEEKKKQLEELQSTLPEAERLMSAGMAVAQAAHDVRNPLTAIDLGLYALENMSPEKDKEEMAKIISTMRSAVKQANEVISDLSQYVRPKSSRKTQIKVRDLIRDSLKMLNIPENVRVDQEMIDPTMTVYGDRAELTRVFQNLAKNAIEAMKETGGGVLKFWPEQREGYTCICVTDTGKGMDPETLKKLFSSFFTTKEHGLGLGLTVVKRFVEDHGGRVEAESVPGKGTTFKILLPMQVQQAPSRPERAQR